jgi:hypothetical protein
MPATAAHLSVGGAGRFRPAAPVPRAKLYGNMVYAARPEWRYAAAGVASVDR